MPEIDIVNCQAMKAFLWIKQAEREDPTYPPRITFGSIPWGSALSALITRLTYNCAHLRSTKEILTFEYCDISFLYHVSIGCHWLIHDGTVSVWGGTGYFLVILGQYGAVLVGTWWYWVNMGRYWFVLGGIRSVWLGTAWYLVVFRGLPAKC